MNLKPLLLIFLIVVSSCASLPKTKKTLLAEKKPLEVSPEIIFNTPHKNWPAREWWKKYQDKQLNQLINLALKSAPLLEVAKARLDSAKNQLNAAGAAGKLIINGTADYERSYLSKNSNTPPPLAGTWGNSYTLGLNAKYDFDFWGKNKDKVKAAVGLANAEFANLELSKQILTTNIVISYFNLNYYLTKIDMLLQQKNLLETMLDASKELFYNGITGNENVLNAENNLNLINQQIASYKALANNSRYALIALIGGGSNYILRLQANNLPEAINSIPDDINYQLLSRRADLEAKKWMVEASLNKIDAAKSAFYPQFSINAFAGLNSISLSSLLNVASKQFILNPELTLPIFNSGALKAELAGAYSAANQVIADYNLSVVEAVKEVYSGAINLAGAQTELELAEKNFKIANQLLNNDLVKYQRGTINKITLLQNQLHTLTKKSEILDIKKQVLISDVTLIKALGGGYRTKNNG